MRHRPLPLIGIAILVAALSACSASSHKAAAEAAASSVRANPAASADLNQAEQALLVNLQDNWKPAHPVKSVTAAIRASFPDGDTGMITTFGLDHFTLAVLTTHGPGSARDTWLQEVYEYGVSKGSHPATSAAPSPAASGTGASS